MSAPRLIVDTQIYRGRRLEYRLLGDGATWDVLQEDARHRIDRHIKEEEEEILRNAATRVVAFFAMLFVGGGSSSWA
jgi:hypothetical protein